MIYNPSSTAYLGAGMSPRPALFITNSTTWTCRDTGIYRICAVGGGGGGGMSYLTDGDSTNYRSAAAGGGGGGYCEKVLSIASGISLTIVVGAAGTAAGNTTAAAGGAGGNTTVVGTGINLTANGGGGGPASTGFQAAVNLTGGSGGTATGGDINYAGGIGGTASLLWQYTAYRAAAGGGASGSPYGVGGAGGSAVGGTSTPNLIAGGGGAVGGIAATSAQGAGTGGVNGENRLGLITPAGADGIVRGTYDSLHSVPTTLPNVMIYGFESVFYPFGCLTGGGGYSSACGAGAGATGGDWSVITINMAGVCGGGAGIYAVTSSTGSHSPIGGGGGGVCSNTTNSYSGHGGKGLVTIERIG